MKIEEPRNYQNNVHFWLRKISYFIAHLPHNTAVQVQNEHHDPLNKGKKEQTEIEMREKLNKKGILLYNPRLITKKEAQEACEKLYEMFNMPLDDDVLNFIEDPRCPGGRLRIPT
jgi:hypothetical protein